MYLQRWTEIWKQLSLLKCPKWLNFKCFSRTTPNTQTLTSHGTSSLTSLILRAQSTQGRKRQTKQNQTLRTQSSEHFDFKYLHHLRRLSSKGTQLPKGQETPSLSDRERAFQPNAKQSNSLEPSTCTRPEKLAQENNFKL